RPYHKSHSSVTGYSVVGLFNTRCCSSSTSYGVADLSSHSRVYRFDETIIVGSD
ncbi:13038_t:CDS:1, partial [Funneliformis geosporum]